MTARFRRDAGSTTFFVAVFVVFGLVFALGEFFTNAVLAGRPQRWLVLSWTFVVRFSLGLAVTGLIMAILTRYERH